MAADPISAVLLLGMGINDFSMSAPSIPLIKQSIRKISRSTAIEIAEQVLAMESSDGIRRYLGKVGKELGI
jgi:phosphotransferase system enzyme I (PtsP)